MANKTIIKAFADKGGASVGTTDLTVSSSLLLPDGTLGGLGLKFKDDTDLGLYRLASDTVGVVTGGVNALTVDGSQRVGIGTTGPDSILHVHAASAGAVTASTVTQLTIENSTNAGLSILSNSANQGTIYFGSTLGNNKGEITYLPATNDMRFYTNNLLGIAIDGSQNVGIGTASPGSKVHAYTDINGAHAIRTENPNSGASATARVEFVGNGGTAFAFKNSTGNSGNGGTDSFNILNESGGVYLAVGDTSWNPITSDANLKTNVEYFDNVLEKVCALKPCHYDWKIDKNALRQTGFLAQELGEVFPEALVRNTPTSEEREYCGDVKYSYRINLEAILVKAIQELSARLEALES